jgi:hypothetical protein
VTAPQFARRQKDKSFLVLFSKNNTFFSFQLLRLTAPIASDLHLQISRGICQLPVSLSPGPADAEHRYDPQAA